MNGPARSGPITAAASVMRVSRSVTCGARISMGSVYRRRFSRPGGSRRQERLDLLAHLGQPAEQHGVVVAALDDDEPAPRDGARRRLRLLLRHEAIVVAQEPGGRPQE